MIEERRGAVLTTVRLEGNDVLLRRGLESGVVAVDGHPGLDAGVFDESGSLTSKAVDDSSRPEYGEEAHCEEEGDSVEGVEVCRRESTSALRKKRRKGRRVRTNFVRDEKTRVTLSELDGTEDAADEDADAADDEGPKEDAPVVDELA